MALKSRIRAVTFSIAIIFMSQIAAANTDDLTIRKTLENWTEAFNSRDTQSICDLFAPNLRYDYRGFPERGFDDICGLLKRSLSDPSKRFAYSLDIKEILVAGDLAVVRLVWTLRMTTNGTETLSQEPGMDIFQRQSDGSWKIIRYMAYEN